MRHPATLLALFLLVSAFFSACGVGPGRGVRYGHPGKHKGWYKNGKW